MTMTDPDAAGDRDLMRRWLDGLSAKARGESAAATATVDRLAPTQPFQTPDVPVAPGEPDPMEPGGVSDPAAVHEHSSRSGYAWGGHQNGRIPAKAMKAIGQGSHRLESTAADAWVAMRAEAAKAGVQLSLTDSYRSYDAQVSVRQRKGHLVATATPGTSVHGWGRAVDANVNDAKTLQWLRANGARFGWINPAWAQRAGKSHEPWHWEYVGVSS